MPKLSDQIEDQEAEITISLKEYRTLLKAEIEASRLKSELRTLSQEMISVKADRLEWEKNAREMKDKFEYIQAMGRLVSKMQKDEKTKGVGNEQDIS